MLFINEKKKIISLSFSLSIYLCCYYYYFHFHLLHNFLSLPPFTRFVSFIHLLFISYSYSFPYFSSLFLTSLLTFLFSPPLSFLSLSFSIPLSLSSFYLHYLALLSFIHFCLIKKAYKRFYVIFINISFQYYP